MDDLNKELLSALEGILPIAVSVSYSMRLGKTQLRRLEKAKEVAAKARAILARDAH